MTARKRGARGLALVIAIGLTGLAGPPVAAGATTVGATFVPDADSMCGGGGVTALQGLSSGGQYAAASNGVITSWSHLAAATSPPPQLKLKVANPQGGDSYTITGESELRAITPGALNQFQTRISVRTGDIIGLIATAAGRCAQTTGAGNVLEAIADDVPPGTTQMFTPIGSERLDISATLEPDADNDGFGDETQDCAPTDPSRHDDCAPPQTTITKGPKDKTKKKQATFEFSSSEPGSTFECSLDGGAFAACSSPDTLKVKKGKHTFSVRAKDSAGNVDGSPASDDWKVKKKKKKK